MNRAIGNNVTADTAMTTFNADVAQKTNIPERTLRKSIQRARGTTAETAKREAPSFNADVAEKLGVTNRAKLRSSQALNSNEGILPCCGGGCM